MILRQHHQHATATTIYLYTLLALAWTVVASSSAGASQIVLGGGEQQEYNQEVSSVSSDDRTSSLSLVHGIHLGTHDYPGLHAQRDFKQHPFQESEYDASTASHYPHTSLPIRSVKGKVWRPSHRARSHVYEAARRRHFGPEYSTLADQLSWKEEETDVPDVTDVETLSSLAKMSSNAYSLPKEGGWYDLSSNNTEGGRSYNLSQSFGWAEDGVRGHVFSSGPNNELVVIALKGTSGFSGGVGAPTGRKDKVNDNLLFSCCCARVDWTWSPVCDCFSGQPNKCNLTCLEDALINKSVYYPTATDLFNNITLKYPTSTIWLTGHSLGGSLAGLLGVTFGIPAVTFEAPGDLLPAKRLHLPLPPGANWDDKRPEFGITHVYTNSDPIPQGVCTGALSSCALVGFALESKCHTGQTIVYDTVGKLGWSVDIRSHRIGVVIDQLLIPDWDKDASPANASAANKASETAADVFAKQTEAVVPWWTWPWKKRRGRKDDKEPSDGVGDGSGDGGDPIATTTATGTSTGQPAPPTPKPSDPPRKKKSHVPPAVIDNECLDCFKWEFFDDDGSNPEPEPSGISSFERAARRAARRRCF